MQLINYIQIKTSNKLRGEPWGRHADLLIDVHLKIIILPVLIHSID